MLSPISPGTIGAGEALLHEALKVHGPENVCLYVAKSLQTGLHIESNNLDFRAEKTVTLPKSSPLNYFTSNPTWLDHRKAFYQRKKLWSQLPDVANDVVAFGKEHHVERMVAVLYDPSITMMVEEIADKLNVPLTCIIWDPPQTTMLFMGYDKYARSIVMDKFVSVLKRADRISVPAIGMNKHFLQSLGLNGIPLVKPIREEELMPESNSRDPSKIVIGFAGSTYSTLEFSALFKTLQRLDWKMEGREIVLRLFTNVCQFPLPFKGQRANIELFGYRPPHEVVRRLAESDILYLPYWIDPRFTLSARTCLPDKLGCYISAGVPILCHGAEYSVPSQLVTEYELGLSCSSYQAEDIITRIKCLSLDPATLANYRLGRRRILDDHYRVADFEETIEQLFGAPKSIASPFSSHRIPLPV